MPVTQAMKDHLAGNVLTLSTLWRVEATDGTVVRASNHTRTLTYQNETYSPAPLDPTQLKLSGDLSPDNAEVNAPLLIGGFAESDLIGGKWNYARVEIITVNYLDVTMGAARRVVGYLGEVTIQSGQFTAELRGLAQLLSQEVGELTAPTCRATLGDARCRKDLTAFTHTATVSAVTDRRTFTVSLSPGRADNYFAYGRAQFTSGANAGLAMEIRANAGNQITLLLPLRSQIAIGDSVTLSAGCDGERSTCRDKFQNVVNIRCEPDLPGYEKVLHFPD
ncbi:MAG: DUF2163 domain-containing protein [Blastocatellia bacterium]